MIGAMHGEFSALAPTTELLGIQTAGSDLYHTAVIPLMLITVSLAWFTRPRTGSEPVPAGFADHQWRFLIVWAVAVCADWLQGPYVYALYASYGFSGWSIALLFVTGFVSAMVFGPIAGCLADTCGRKRACIVYCILYMLSCVTKHSNNFAMLMLGRLTGGAATSILFSVFECYLVAEHRGRQQFSQGLLRYMFGMMYCVQYLVAIAAGFMAQRGVSWAPLTKVKGFESLHYGGYITPFDMSFVACAITLPLVAFLWTENYGSADPSSTVLSKLASARDSLRTSSSVWLVGLVVAFFEGAMYAFVFNWTPALESQSASTPHGIIFSCFMMCCMCGASVFSLTDPQIPPILVLWPTVLLSAVALAIVAFFLRSSSLTAIFACFLVFEFCVGVYYPAMGTVKSEVVSEDARAGVYCLYRVPLNGVVAGVLLLNMSMTSAFTLCAALLVAATFVLMPLCRPAVKLPLSQLSHAAVSTYS